MDAKLYWINCHRHLRKIVENVKLNQLGNPTPCSEWNVHDLMHHITNENLWVKPLLEGKTIKDVGDSLNGDFLQDSPVENYLNISNEAEKSAFELNDLSKIVHLSYGDFSAEYYLFENGSDYLIHSWDLSKGINYNDKLPQDLVEICYKIYKPREKELKESKLFGDFIEVDKNEDLQTKLLAVFGRKR